MRQVKQQACTAEWTPYLDDFLAQAIIRNYFNFELVAAELNQEQAKRRVDKEGAASASAPSQTGPFTPEKCRIRWSYIHLKVSPPPARRVIHLCCVPAA